MRLNIKKSIFFLAAAALTGSLTSCEDYLDVQPETGITPENYFKSDAQLMAWVDAMYDGYLPSHGGVNWSYGMFGWDSGTDNQTGRTPNDVYVGQRRLDLSDGNYSFTGVHRCNYFFKYVMPKYEENTITGNKATIDHAIGEVHFMRAMTYFSRLKDFGDFPIITDVLIDDETELIAASKRSPRNEVARFIIEDLQTAAEKFKDTDAKVDGVAQKTRLNYYCAQMMISRVALYEATWLKYHASEVPGGENWNGNKQYPNYQYPAGSREAEINYFLELCIDASAKVADNYPLVQNTGLVQQSATEPANPYMDMYATTDMSPYSEVILWRQYDKKKVGHCAAYHAQSYNASAGTTRSLVNSFLMADGMPTYASSFDYNEAGIKNVRKNRDARITVWLKEPGQINYFYNEDSPDAGLGQKKEPTNPAVTNEDTNKGIASTGYLLRIGNSYDAENAKDAGNFTGSPSFMANEAYVNYIEAYYLRYGNLGGNVKKYWDELHTKHARISASMDATIAATDMSKEVADRTCGYDWGAFSNGQVIDATLYTIRRERRCELMALGFRWADLCRWAALDQLMDTKYHIEGFQLWDGTNSNKPVAGYTYRAKSLLCDPDDDKSMVSSEERSVFFRPFEVQRSNYAFDGVGWHKAYYLRPVPVKQFTLTGGTENGMLYQNPYWGTTPNELPLK